MTRHNQSGWVEASSAREQSRELPHLIPRNCVRVTVLPVETLSRGKVRVTRAIIRCGEWVTDRRAVEAQCEYATWPRYYGWLMTRRVVAWRGHVLRVEAWHRPDKDAMGGDDDDED